MPAGIAYGRGSRTVCDRIQGARWGSIAVLFAVATLLATLVPNRAAAQAASLVIETVPPIEGVNFEVDGKTYSTDEEGVATIDEVVPGKSEVRTPDRGLLTDSQRIEFVTWSDGVAESNRVVDIEGSTRLQVGFRVDFLVAETFRTSEGEVLSPESVGPFAVVDDAGESTTFPGSSAGLAGPTARFWDRFPPGTRWLPANRIVPENGQLGAQEASYAVRWVICRWRAGECVERSVHPFRGGRVGHRGRHVEGLLAGVLATRVDPGATADRRGHRVAVGQGAEWQTF